MRVECDRDLFLPLYRHWTVQESLTHALPIASAVKVWTGSGTKKIKQLVAEIGMPLTQANEQYHYMEQKYVISAHFSSRYFCSVHSFFGHFFH